MTIPVNVYYLRYGAWSATSLTTLAQSIGVTTTPPSGARGYCSKSF